MLCWWSETVIPALPHLPDILVPDGLIPGAVSKHEVFSGTEAGVCKLSPLANISKCLAWSKVQGFDLVSRETIWETS
jgi:hypothetical protein